MNQKKNLNYCVPNPPENNAKTYLKYTGIGFELCAIIGLGVWAGYALDGYFQTEQPWFTIIASFVATILAMFFLYRRLPKD